jgi:hypothetical protein
MLFFDLLLEEKKKKILILTIKIKYYLSHFQSLKWIFFFHEFYKIR